MRPTDPMVYEIRDDGVYENGVKISSSLADRPAPTDGTPSLEFAGLFAIGVLLFTIGATLLVVFFPEVAALLEMIWLRIMMAR